MKARELRKSILKTSYKAKACHIGSALSCVEILLAIDKVKKKNDTFLFSKASGISAYYCLLAEKGMIPKNKLVHYLKNYPLAHKDVPGIVHSVGSIGHGLNVAVGMAFADRKNKVYCLISDGELNEGSTWEAIMFAAHHKLDNLIVFLDNNGLQACGATEDILNLDSLEYRFTAFDWISFRIYGHNINNIKFVLGSKWNLPKIIICDTIKGEGISFMEGRYEWHYKNLTQELLDWALEQIN